MGVLNGLWSALRFLTALPAPDPGPVPARVAAPWYPLAGAVAGALAASAAGLAGLFWPSSVQAVAAVVATVWVTGGLHLDGLMDVADGFGSRQPQEQARAAMRDSRIGAAGGLAGAMALLVRFALLLALPATRRWRVLIVAAAVSRTGLVWGAWRGPQAKEGMGAAFAAGLDGKAAGLTLGVGAALALGLAGWAGLLALAVTLASTAVVRWRLYRRLGGLTGDMLGALAEMGEWAALAVFAARWPL